MPFALNKRISHAASACLLQGAASSWEDSGVYGPGPVIKMGPNDYRMWYEGFTTGPVLKVGYATSPDGVNWSKYGSNPVMSASGSGTGTLENDENSPSSVIWDADDGVFKMWYHAGNDPGGTSGRCICYATSSDGITWSKYGSNPVMVKGTSGQWDDKWVADCKIIKVATNDYRMWYGGVNVSTVKRQVGYATSTDGITWTKYGSNPIIANTVSGWDSGGIHAFCPIMVSATEWHGWYIAVDGSAIAGIGYVSSSDGITWTKGSLNPVLQTLQISTTSTDGPVAAIHVYQDGAIFRVMRGSYVTSPSTLRQKRTDIIRPAMLP